MQPKAILMLGAHRQTLAVMRALGPLGWRIVYGHDENAPTSFVARSRWTNEVWRHPGFGSNPEVWVDALDQLLVASPDIRYVFPTGEEEIVALDALHDQLSARIRCVMVSSTVLQRCMDKIGMLKLADELAIPLAPFLTAHGYDELIRAADAVGFPCVVRPAASKERIVRLKALIANCPTKLTELAERMPLSQGPLIVQRYVHGQRYNLYYLATMGRVRVAAMTRTDRSSRPDGTGNTVKGVSVPIPHEWMNHLERLCEALEYDGAGCLQYLVDPVTGESTILEINPRIGANYSACERLGMRLPQWWINYLEHGDPDIPEIWQYPSGIRYSWLAGALEDWYQASRDPSIDGRTHLRWAGHICKMLLAGHHLTWDWRDPLPSLPIYMGLLRKFTYAPMSRKKRAVGKDPKQNQSPQFGISRKV